MKAIGAALLGVVCGTVYFIVVNRKVTRSRVDSKHDSDKFDARCIEPNKQCLVEVPSIQVLGTAQKVEDNDNGIEWNSDMLEGATKMLLLSTVANKQVHSPATRQSESDNSTMKERQVDFKQFSVNMLLIQTRQDVFS